MRVGVRTVYAAVVMAVWICEKSIIPHSFFVQPS